MPKTRKAGYRHRRGRASRHRRHMPWAGWGKIAPQGHARTVMLDQSEEYSLLLAENLNQQVFRGFVLPTVIRYGKIALSTYKELFSSSNTVSVPRHYFTKAFNHFVVIIKYYSFNQYNFLWFRLC